LKIANSQNQCITDLSLCSIENLFQGPDEPNCECNFFQFITELLTKSPWIGLPDESGFYKEACLRLAFDVNAYNERMGSNEPHYHNRQHFKDVCTSLTLLLNQKVKSVDHLTCWELSPKDFWILLLCAIGHDYGHDGSMNSFPCQLEKQSIERIKISLGALQQSTINIDSLMAKIEPMVLATDPSNLKGLLSTFSGSQINPNKMACLCMLLVEADLLASTLPKRGLLLGQQLAKEWETANPKAALVVTKPQGRINFLEHIRFISPYAIMLGLEDVRQESINQLKASL
jgi:hypothetical protein